jgi:hypothetical protein
MKRLKSSGCISLLNSRWPCSDRNFRSISQKPGIASIGKALSTRRTAGRDPTALFCLRILGTGCVWTGTGARSGAKLYVTMDANGSSIFINDFPLRYIPDTADFNSSCLIDMPNSRTDGKLGWIQSSLDMHEARGRFLGSESANCGSLQYDCGRTTGFLFGEVARSPVFARNNQVVW